MRNRTEMNRNRHSSSHESFSTADQRLAETNRNILEQQNDEKMNALSGQIARLKELSIDINDEVADQNKMLDGMGGDMGSVSQLLNDTVGKLGMMLKSGGQKHMFYLIGFVVFSFILIYYMMNLKAKASESPIES